MAASIQFDGELAFGRPVSAGAGFGARFDHSKALLGEDELRLLACDRSGQVLGKITVWIDDRDTTGVCCDFADGFAVIVVTPEGEILTDATLPRRVVVERADLIISYLEPYEPEEAAQFSMPGSSRQAAAAGEPDQQWTCPFSAILAACECLPEVQPPWKKQAWS